MSATDPVQAVTEALAEHWRDMHTNESLGYQRMLATHAVAAAEPHLIRKAKAAALREAADSLHDPTCLGCSGDDEMVVMADWLRERADRIERGQA